MLVFLACRADLTAKRRERVRADARAQELRSDLRRGLSKLAGPLPEEVLGPLNASREQQAFQAALTHLQAVSWWSCCWVASRARREGGMGRRNTQTGFLGGGGKVLGWLNANKEEEHSRACSR